MSLLKPNLLVSKLIINYNSVSFLCLVSTYIYIHEDKHQCNNLMQ